MNMSQELFLIDYPNFDITENKIISGKCILALKGVSSSWVSGSSLVDSDLISKINKEGTIEGIKEELKRSILKKIQSTQNPKKFKVIYSDGTSEIITE